METSTLFIALVLAVVACIAESEQAPNALADAGTEYERLRRTGAWFGPRLGRRDRRTEGRWALPPGMNDGEDYFPSGDSSQQTDVKHLGMWFGPRLGRRARRSLEDEENFLRMYGVPSGVQLDSDYLDSEKELQSAKYPGLWFGPRLGRRRRSTQHE